MSHDSLDRVYIASLALQREGKALRDLIRRNVAGLSLEGQNPEIWLRMFTEANAHYEAALKLHVEYLVSTMPKTERMPCQPAITTRAKKLPVQAGTGGT